MLHQKVGHFFLSLSHDRIIHVVIQCNRMLSVIDWGKISDSRVEKRPKSEFIDLKLNPARSFFV
jgi:hypothetical protein